MAEATKIEWAHTFNPWWGCAKVSPGCAHCYAEVWARRWGVHWGPDARRRLARNSTWTQPLAWDARARRLGVRHRVFCASMADVFEDRPELDPWRIRLLALVALTPHLDWLLLTKRPDVMARVMTDSGLYRRVLDAANEWRREHPSRQLSRWPVTNPSDGWHNLWAGTTVENQEQADARFPHLLRVPARVRFLSVEPLLGPITLSDRSLGACACSVEAMEGAGQHAPSCPASYSTPRIDWVIAGGESGQHARPMHPDWVRSLRWTAWRPARPSTRRWPPGFERSGPPSAFGPSSKSWM